MLPCECPGRQRPLADEGCANGWPFAHERESAELGVAVPLESDGALSTVPGVEMSRKALWQSHRFTPSAMRSLNVPS